MTAGRAARALAACVLVACAPAVAPAPRTQPAGPSSSPSGAPRWLGSAAVSAPSPPAPPATEEPAGPARLPDEDPSDPLADTPFHRYVRDMHAQLHPEFSGRVLGALARLGPSHPLSDPRLEAVVELALGPDGRIAFFGIVRTSGASDFDVGVIESIQRAAPFPKPPAALLAPDGLFHVVWTFSRDPSHACGPSRAHAP